MSFETNWYAFIRDSLLIMVAWFFMATSFYSWGIFFKKIIGINIVENKKYAANIWFGWLFCILFFTVYHLFFPINAFVSCIFYIPSSIYFFIKFSKKIPLFIKKLGFVKLSAFLLIAFSVAMVSIQIPVNYDTGLYHLNSIRWANEYHIIKGLGNLHSRLGFNQLFFLYSASLNFHPFLNNFSYHAANSFLYILFYGGLLLNGTFIDLILICLFFFIPMPYHWVNSPTPDFASTIIQLTAFRYFLDLIYYNGKENKNGITVLILLLSAILVCIKLSNIIFALGLSLLLLKTLKTDKNIKLTIKPFVFICLLFIVWIIRSYIQTGYPLYPSSFGRINFEWTVPSEITENTEKSVYVFARLHDYDVDSPKLQNWNWVNEWIRRNIFDKNQYLKEDFLKNLFSILILIFQPMAMFNWGMGSLTLSVLGTLLIILWTIKTIKQKDLFRKSDNIFYLILVCVASILFWFFMAPDIRFANGIFIIFFVSSLLLLSLAYPKLKVNCELKKYLIFYPFILFIWAFILCYSVDTFYIDGVKDCSKVQMKTYITNSGLKIFIPVLSDQCWDSVLPSTPEPRNNLHLIGKNISEGFSLK